MNEKHYVLLDIRSLEGPFNNSFDDDDEVDDGDDKFIVLFDFLGSVGGEQKNGAS